MRPSVGDSVRVRLCPNGKVEQATVVQLFAVDGESGFSVEAPDERLYWFADQEEGIVWWPALEVQP